MVVKAALVGGFPRPFKVGRLMSRYRDGKLAEDVYEKKLEEELLKNIRRIVEAGVSTIPGNMFLWDGMFEPFASSFEGVERGGLYRFLDNNFYYRIPVVKGKIKHRDATVNSLKTIRKIARRGRLGLTVKAVLPGPYTFAKMCENKYYASDDELVTDVAEALGEEARMLERLGIRLIEIHEPMLVSGDVQFSLFKKGFETMVSRFSAETWLQTYFGSISTFLRELSELRVNVLGVDLVEAPGQFETVLSFKAGWGLGLGAVDSRSTRVETLSSLRMLIKKASESFSRIYLTPNTMMDFIPVSIAYAKIKRMGRAVGGFRNG